MFYGENGQVDALKCADILRSLKLTPTIKSVNKMTGCDAKTKAGTFFITDDMLDKVLCIPVRSNQTFTCVR
jgi:hypothetical protein